MNAFIEACLLIFMLSVIGFLCNIAGNLENIEKKLTITAVVEETPPYASSVLNNTKPLFEEIKKD